MPFLDKHLQPVTPADETKLDRWIRDLDDEDFNTRENASEALEQLNWGAEATLRRTLVHQLSAELRRRVALRFDGLTSLVRSGLWMAVSKYVNVWAETFRLR